MTGFLLGVVRFVFIPLVMLTGLVLAVLIARATREPSTQVAAYAGVFAGLVAGSTLAIVQLASGQHEDDNRFDFNVWAVLIGLIVGLAVPMTLPLARRTKVITGPLTLLFSSASSLAVLNYLFNGATRDFTMLLAMSLLFGVLVHIVFNPDAFKELRAIWRADLPTSETASPTQSEPETS
ncbi:hypothetical protein [Lentzea sp. NPDC059081]|uniref:hypothetical protein n=1 Tax=Lentzea sp. NPDC059081 TaxID=3346719 RepID=UPI0036980AA8